MPLPLYYFLAITAINILMSWALYVPYRMAHLHFIVVANMAISGYTAAYLVLSLHLPFGLALLAGFALGAADRLPRRALHRRRPDLRGRHRGLHLHLHHPHGHREHRGRGRDDGALRPAQHRRQRTRAPLDDPGHPLRARPGRGLPDPPLRPLAAGPRRLGRLHRQGPHDLARHRHPEARHPAADLQLHPGRRVRGALRVHLQELPPGLLHLSRGRDPHDRHLRGRLLDPVGDRPGRARALRGAAALPARGGLVAHRDLRRAAHPGAGAQARGLHHHPVRLPRRTHAVAQNNASIPNATTKEVV